MPSSLMADTDSSAIVASPIRFSARGKGFRLGMSGEYCLVDDATHAAHAGRCWFVLFNGHTGLCDANRVSFLEDDVGFT